MRIRGKPLQGGSFNRRLRALAAVVFVLAGRSYAGGCRGSLPRATPVQTPSSAPAPPNTCPTVAPTSRSHPSKRGASTRPRFSRCSPLRARPAKAGEECSIAYMSYGGAFAGAPGNEIPNAYLGTRWAEGWRTTALTPPTPQAPANSSPQITYAFSEDLSQTVLRAPLQQLTADAPAGVYNLFLRGAERRLLAGHRGDARASARSRMRPLLPAPGRTRVRGRLRRLQPRRSSRPTPASSKAPRAKAWKTSTNPRTNTCDSRGSSRTARSRHRARAPAAGSKCSTDHTGELAHAISADGSRVLFEAESDGGARLPRRAGRFRAGRPEPSYTTASTAPARSRSRRPQPARNPLEMRNRGTRLRSAASPVLGCLGGRLGRLLHQHGRADEATRTPDRRGRSLPLRRRHAHAQQPARRRRARSGQGGRERARRGWRLRRRLVRVLRGERRAGVGRSEREAEPVRAARHGRRLPARVSYIATLKAPDDTEEEEPDEEENVEAERAGGGTPYRSDLLDWTSRPTESQAYVTPDGRHLAFMSVRTADRLRQR